MNLIRWLRKGDMNMTGSQKQIEWADRIIAKAQAQADELIATAKLQVGYGDFDETHIVKASLIVGSLMQDLRKVSKASDIIDRYKGGVNFEPIVIRLIGAWTPEIEAKLTAKLAA